MDSQIRRATSSDLPAAAAVLAEAFDQYPWTRWCLPADNYAERLTELQEIYLGHALENGAVLVDDKLRGVVAVLAPDAAKIPETTFARIAELHGDRLSALVSIELPEHPASSWDFATLGVLPDHQGAGLGSALTAAAISAIEERDDSALVALETSDERNVRLYERAGFEVTVRTEIPDGPIVHSMVRR